MDTAKKLLLGAVSIVLAVALIVILMNVFNKGRDSVNSSMDEYDRITSASGDIQYTLYENATVSGSVVLDYISSLEKQDDGVKIVVVNAYTSTTYSYTSSTAAAYKSALKNAKTKSTGASSAYINPTQSFDCTVCRDTNSTVYALVFVQTNSAVAYTTPAP